MTFDAKGWFGHEQMVDEGLLAGGKHRAHRLRRGSRRVGPAASLS